MNLTSNEWMEITTHHTLYDLAQPFVSPTTKFLYPKKGEAFSLRLVGPLMPFYRMYINPSHMWSYYCSTEDLKKCIRGNEDVILAVAETLVGKIKYLSDVYWVDKDNKTIMTKPINFGDIKCSPNGFSVKLPENKIAEDRISFLRKCLEASRSPAALWTTCIIANAYIREGTRQKHSIQPLVITKSMFFNMIRAYAQIKNIADSSVNSISGINAFDLVLLRGVWIENAQRAPVILKILNEPNTLTYDEISHIIKQKLLNINTFVQMNNKQAIEACAGFIYRPFKSDKDIFETMKMLQGMEKEDQEEQYETTEKEICNIPDELVNENIYENGPISDIELV